MLRWMSARFGTGTLVDYAGACWRVSRALGVETDVAMHEMGSASLGIRMDLMPAHACRLTNTRAQTSR